MDKTTLTKRLRELATDAQHRSKASQLRDVIDDVEAALAAGVPRATVVAELGKHGLQMSLTTFDSTMRRIRQKRLKTTTQKTANVSYLPKLPPASSSVDEISVQSTSAHSHDPYDLDKIIASQPDLAALAKLAKRKKT